jgi:hypothetical protein
MLFSVILDGIAVEARIFDGGGLPDLDRLGMANLKAAARFWEPRRNGKGAIA